MKGLHTGDSGLVGSQHPAAEPLPQKPAQVLGGMFHHVIMLMLQENINQMIVRRVMEQGTFPHLLVGESLVIMGHDLPYHWSLRIACLQNDQSLTTLSARAPADLRHHHESMLVSPEVGIV